MLIATRRANAFLLLSILIGSTAVQAQQVCQKLNGEWAGTMSGRFAGPVSMSISNCKMNWKLPDGRMNYCSLSETSGKLEYACSLGSRGTVVIQGKKITMRNTYTGNEYFVSVVRN